MSKAHCIEMELREAEHSASLGLEGASKRHVWTAELLADTSQEKRVVSNARRRVKRFERARAQRENRR